MPVAFDLVTRSAYVAPDRFDLCASDQLVGQYAGKTYPGFYNLDGKTKVSAALVGGQRTVTLICAGQSNFVNVTTTPYTPSSSLVHNFNVYDGGMYRAADPLLGCSQTAAVAEPAGSMMGRIGQGLIDAGGVDRVILVPIALGGTSSYLWQASGAHCRRIKVAIDRLAAIGLTADGLLWCQGEGDAAAILNTPQATYAANLGSAIAKSRTDGFAGPWFIAKQSWSGAGPNIPTNYINANIQNAQIALVNHGNGVWAGPDLDTLDNTKRLDFTHFSDTGMADAAALWVTAIRAYGAPFA